jgi:hypothetical protein
MAKFLLVVAACVTGTTVVGNLLDKAPTSIKSGSGNGDESNLNVDSDSSESKVGAAE